MVKTKFIFNELPSPENKKDKKHNYLFLLLIFFLSDKGNTLTNSQITIKLDFVLSSSYCVCTLLQIIYLVAQLIQDLPAMQET